MAICLVIFNPTNSKRILMNYHYVVNEFKLQGLPVFSLELVYKGRSPQIADAFHVYAKSYMFHKENLCRILEKKIPESYTKLAFLDADILFRDKEWYSKVSELLNEYDVVHPYEAVHNIDLTFTKILKVRETVLKFKPIDNLYVDCIQGSPGFGWCMRREWYNKVGFFDDNPIGGGDAFSVAKWLNVHYYHYKTKKGLNSLTCKQYEKYRTLESPKITYLKKSIILHLYHGQLINRGYVSRNLLFEGNSQSFEEITYINEDGVIEWKEPDAWNPKLLTYFLGRCDDDLSCECSGK